MSISGVATRLFLPEVKLTFDLGSCPPEFVPEGTRVAFTHGHMDHVAGAPYLAAMRALQGLSPPEFIYPAHLESRFVQLLDAAEQLDESEHPCELTPLTDDSSHRIGKDLLLRARCTDHTVPATAYEVWHTTKRLKEEFAGRPGKELALLRKQGVALEDTVTSLIVAYTGDTRVSVLDTYPELCAAEHLLLECTYLGSSEKDGPGAAARRGHIHLQDLIERADRFQCRELTLVHPSARYDDQDLRGALEKLPEQLRTRTHWLGGD